MIITCLIIAASLTVGWKSGRKYQKSKGLLNS